MSRKNPVNVASRESLNTKPAYDKAPKATAEQLRIAQIYNDDDPDLKVKVNEVQELTGCSEERAVMALHDCEYEVERAVNLLYEQESGEQQSGEQNEWQVSTKKHSKKFISSTSSDNIHVNAENNSKIDHHTSGAADEMGDVVNIRPPNASRGRRRGGGNSGENRQKRDKKDRYSNNKSNNGDVSEDRGSDKPNYSEEQCEDDFTSQNKPEFTVNKRGRRIDERWSSNRGRGMSRSDRGFGSQREGGSYSGRGSWRRNDSGRGGGNRGGRGRLVVSRKEGGLKKWHGDDHRGNSFDEAGVMEIDTWNNSQANMNRPEPEGWDDSGDLEGEWKGDSLIVTNSLTASESVSCLDPASKLLREEFDRESIQKQSRTISSENVSSDTKSARDAYNRMATESIKNAIGLRRRDPQNHQRIGDPSDSKQTQNSDPYNIILGQRHSKSKPPPPSTHIPEAPIQLAPTLQPTQSSINCQFGFGTGPFISDVKSQEPSNSCANSKHGSTSNPASSKIDRKHLDSSIRPEAPVSIPTGSSGDRLHHGGGLSDVIATTSLDIGIQSSLVQNVPNSSTNQSQHGQSKMYDSTTSVPSHHHPSTQQSSAVNSNSSTNAFSSNFQNSQQGNTSSNAKVAPSQSPFSSPMKPVSISSGSGGNTNFDSNSQSMFSSGSYQSHYSSNTDNLQNENQMSKLSLSEGQQSKESSSASNIQQPNFVSHPKNISQQQQQSAINNQIQQQMKNSNSSTSTSNVPSSTNNTFQHLPPGIAPPMVAPHGLPFPYLNFPLDYETLAAQQRLMFELQHNFQVPSSNSDLPNTSGSTIKSAGLGTSSLQRSDVQSPPSTTNSSQTNSGGHQLPQQGNLGAPPATLTMPFNLYYLAAAAANQPNQFYPQFIPSSAALGSLFHQTATQTPGQNHLNNTIPAQQYPPQPAKPLSAFNNFGSSSLHDDLEQMSKYTGPGALGKSGYTGVKQQGTSSSGYHSTSLQQQAHQNDLKTGTSLNSNSNSSAGAGNQVVGGHMPGSTAGSGPGNNNNVPNPGFTGFPLSNNYPNLPHIFPNSATASGSPATFMTMPGVGGANPGLMHHSQDSGNNRLVNTGSASGSKQQLKSYPFWNS